MCNTRFLTFLLLCVFMSTIPSCSSEPYTLDIEEIDNNEMSVISVLENGIEFGALVSRVFSLNESDVRYAVEDAVVVLYEDMVPIDTLAYVEPRFGNADPLSSGQYISDDVMSLRSGSYYHLTVEAPGLRPAESEPVLFTKVFSDQYSVELNSDTIGNFVEQQPVIFFETLTSDNCEIVDGTFQRPLAMAEDDAPFTNFSRYLLPFSSGDARRIIGCNLPAGMYNFEYGAQSSEIDSNISPLIVCYSIIYNTPHLRVFSEALSNQGREGIGGFDADPVILPSNIIGGHGYFSVRDRQLMCFRYN